MHSFGFDYWHVKIFYDIVGYVTAVLVTWIFSQKVIEKDELPNPFENKRQRQEYYLYVIA